MIKVGIMGKQNLIQKPMEIQYIKELPEKLMDFSIGVWRLKQPFGKQHIWSSNLILRTRESTKNQTFKLKKIIKVNVELKSQNCTLWKIFLRRHKYKTKTDLLIAVLFTYEEIRVKSTLFAQGHRDKY